MGKTKSKPAPELPEDEQGAPWPPATALAAQIERYGGDPSSPCNGVLVELGAYLPDTLMFEAHLTAPVHVVPTRRLPVGEVVYAFLRELRPLNAYAQIYIDNAVSVAVPVYAAEVYDLRDRLDAIGVAVKAESVNEWKAAQRAAIRELLDVIESGGVMEDLSALKAKLKELP